MYPTGREGFRPFRARSRRFLDRWGFETFSPESKSSNDNWSMSSRVV